MGEKWLLYFKARSIRLLLLIKVMYGNLKGQSKKSQFGARSVTLLTAAPSNKINSCAEIFKQSMKVVVPARKATQPGGIGSLESILGLLKSLKIRAQFEKEYMLLKVDLIESV